MRIAVLCDVHGNLDALSAVLAQVRAAGVDEILVGGDVFPGPFPVACVEALDRAGIPCRFVRGNGESAVLAARVGRDLPRVPESFRGAIRWNADGLTPEWAARLERWPLTERAEVPGLGAVLFCHATPRDDDEIFTRLTPEAALAPIFAACGAAIVVCGHTHMPFDRRIGAVRVVNAGSVGMPFGGTGADWLLLDGRSASLVPRHADYDLDAAAARIRAGAYPAAEFAAEAILQPRSADAMTALYEPAVPKPPALTPDRGPR